MSSQALTLGHVTLGLRGSSYKASFLGPLPASDSRALTSSDSGPHLLSAPHSPQIQKQCFATSGEVAAPKWASTESKQLQVWAEMLKMTAFSGTLFSAEMPKKRFNAQLPSSPPVGDA